MSVLSNIKKSIVSAVMAKPLSNEGRAERHAKAEAKRVKLGARHEVVYFHQVDDPYSVLAAQVLKPLIAHYDIELKIRIVDVPEDGVAPEREKLKSYSRSDAALIADRYGLSFVDSGEEPSRQNSEKAAAMLVKAIQNGTFLDVVNQVSAALWRGKAFSDLPLCSPDETKSHIETSTALRKKYGHYLGGVFCYGGECFWGVDRLHYLEERLQSLGVSKTDGSEILYPPPVALAKSETSETEKIVDLFVSLRSPYSAIVAKRVFDLAKRKGARVRIRYVLPMVMRGLPIPREKAMYIVHDTAREAHRVGVPFGRINDPLGLPTERGLSIMPLAEEKGVAEKYLVSFLEGVWAEGINAGTDKGLRIITDRAGLDWKDIKLALSDTRWRKIAEDNRTELAQLGLWGVPSFHCEETVLWGQDRLWALEEAL